MSIEKMMRLHPKAGAGFDEAVATAARHAMLCSLFCSSCADACLAEAMDMSRCIRTCLDGSDICTSTAHLLVRQTGENGALVLAQIELCIQACETCAAECGSHDHDHCRLCATMCRECAEDCRKALAVLH